MAIASVTIKCSECGKEFEHRRKCYNRGDANDYEAWAAGNIKLCPDCYREQNRERKEAHEKEVVKNIEFSPLTGSEKQIAWANSIRRAAIANVVEKFGLERISPRAIEILTHEIVDSRWWIDRRFDVADHIGLNRQIKKYMEEHEYDDGTEEDYQ